MKAVYLLLSLLAVHVYARFTHIDEYTFLKDLRYGANTFAFKLYKTALKNEPGNSIISPLSVYITLGMASYGAEGVTKEELLSALYLPRITEVESSIGAKESLKGIIRKYHLMESVFVGLGHKIFAGSDFSVNRDYQDFLEDIFNSPLENVNFKNAPEAAQDINRWIRSVSAGRIDDIIDPVELDPSMNLMLVNSVYFSGRWKIPFDASYTAHYPFHVNGNLTEKVLTMYKAGPYQNGELPKMDAKFVVLPYQNGGNSMESIYMYIIVPNEVNGLAALEENIDSLTLEDLENTKNSVLELFVPKFRIVSKFALKDDLIQLGIETAFSETANFNGITEKHEGVSISQVVQKTSIAVDEMGTEAAASPVAPSIFRIRGDPFKVDRPFLIIVATDNVILFTGKVVYPSV